MELQALGIDLGKTSFHVVGVDLRGGVVVRKRMSRTQLLHFTSNLRVGLIAWLIRFLEHRIKDRRILRLIQKWLKAGVLEDGVVRVSEEGAGQGSVISPLLANVYLHYTFDLWAERWRRREATGDMVSVRYADDIVLGFQHEGDARRFWEAMRERLREFSLTLHPERTRLIMFGRYAAQQRAERRLGKPETFNFLGF